MERPGTARPAQGSPSGRPQSSPSLLRARGGTRRWCLPLRPPGTSEVTGLFRCVALMSPRRLKPRCFPTDGGGAVSSVGWTQLLLVTGTALLPPRSELGALPACLLTPAFCPRTPHGLTPVPQKGLVPKTAALGQVRLQPLQARDKKGGLLTRSVGTRVTFVKGFHTSSHQVSGGQDSPSRAQCLQKAPGSEVSHLAGDGEARKCRRQTVGASSFPSRLLASITRPLFSSLPDDHR